MVVNHKCRRCQNTLFASAACLILLRLHEDYQSSSELILQLTSGGLPKTDTTQRSAISRLKRHNIEFASWNKSNSLFHALAQGQHAEVSIRPACRLLGDLGPDKEDQKLLSIMLQSTSGRNPVHFNEISLPASLSK